MIITPILFAFLLQILGRVRAQNAKSPIVVHYPEKKFDIITINDDEESAPNASAEVKWSFDTSMLTENMNPSKIHTCIEIAHVELDSNGSQVSLVGDDLLVPLRCYNIESGAIRSIVIANITASTSLQVRFLHRDTNENDLGILKMHEWRVFTVQRLPSSTPNKELPLATGGGLQSFFYQKPGSEKNLSRISIQYELIGSEPSSVLYDRKLIEVCFTIQSLDPTLQGPLSSHQFNESDSDSDSDSPSWKDLFDNCVQPADTPDDELLYIHVDNLSPSKWLYRVEMYSKYRPEAAKAQSISSDGKQNDQNVQQNRDGKNDIPEKTESARMYTLLSLINPPIIKGPKIIEWPANIVANARKNAAGKIPFTAEAEPGALEISIWCLNVYIVELSDNASETYDIAKKYGAENVSAVLDEASRWDVQLSLKHNYTVVTRNKKNTEDVSFEFLKPQFFSNESKVNVCSPMSPANGSSRSFELADVPAGIYKLVVEAGTYDTTSSASDKLSIGQAYSSSYNSPLSSKEAILVVQEEKEFIPSYEWQEIYGWNTVPAGAESRLHLSELPVRGDSNSDITKDMIVSDRRQTRIMNPFQLQLKMPAPCKYFYRANIFKDTTVAKIEEDASVQCTRELPPMCLELVDEGTGQRMESSATAIQADLFNHKVKLQISDRVQCRVNIASAKEL